MGIISSLVSGAIADATNKANTQVARENMQLQRDLNAQNIAFQQAANEANLAYQREANAQNLALARETNAQNEALMREGWSRDDTAYQRKAADLAAAGLSKTLAAGGSAMSSSPVKLSTPQVSAQSVNAVNAGISPYNDFKKTFPNVNFDLLNTAQMAQEFATKISENKLLSEQIRSASANADIQEARAKFATQLAGLDFQDKYNRNRLNYFKWQIAKNDFENWSNYKNQWVHDADVFLKRLFPGFDYTTFFSNSISTDYQ